MARTFAIVLVLTLLVSSQQSSDCWAIGVQESVIEINESAQRTWKSADGKFQQAGKLVAIEGDKIRLVTPQGKRLTIPLNKLSAADQKFVEAEKSQLGSNPFESDEEENPFMNETGESSNRAAASRKLIQINFFTAKPIKLQSKDPVDFTLARWRISDLADSIDPIRIPASVHVRPNGCFSSSDNKLLIVSLHDPFGGKLNLPVEDFGSPLGGEPKAPVEDFENPPGGNNLDNAREMARRIREMQTNGNRNRSGARGLNSQSSMENWVELYQLPTGEKLGSYPSGKVEISDFDSERNVFLACGGLFSINGILEIVALENEQLVTKKTGVAAGRMGNSIRSARFLSDGKIVVELPGSLVVLDGDNFRPKFSASHFGQGIRLANDRRHAIVSHEGRKFEVDLVEGKCVGVKGTLLGSSNVGFPAPDGTRTAELADHTLRIRQGEKIVDEFFVPVGGTKANLIWLNDDILRAESGQHQVHLIDLKNRVALMELLMAGGSMGSERGWNVDKDLSQGEAVLVISPVKPISLGQDELPSTEELRANLGGEGDELLILQKGDRVSIQVDLKADPSVAAAAREIVETILSKRGVIVDDGADDELRLESSATEEKIEYREFGSPPWENNTQTVTVRRVSSSLSLARDGKIVWSIGSSSGSPGMMLTLEKGQTAQQAVDKLNVSPAQFWKTLSLPRQVAIHPQGRAWVRYRKTAEGFEAIN